MSTTAFFVEQRFLCGRGSTEPLSAEKRTEIAEWASELEECQRPVEKLLSLSDADLVAVGYWAMVEYTRGMA